VTRAGLLTRTFALEAFGRHQQAGSIDPHEGVAFSRVEARRSRHLRRIGKECRTELPVHEDTREEPLKPGRAHDAVPAGSGSFMRCRPSCSAARADVSWRSMSGNGG
jgi:hypothetical protein